MSYPKQYNRLGDNRHAELTTSASAPIAFARPTCAPGMDGDARWQSGYRTIRTPHNRRTPPTSNRRRYPSRRRDSTGEACGAARVLTVGTFPSPTGHSPSRRRCLVVSRGLWRSSRAWPYSTPCSQLFLHWRCRRRSSDPTSCSSCPMTTPRMPSAPTDRG